MNEKIKVAMDLATVLSVEEIAKQTDTPLNQTLLSLMKSRTGQMIYDDSTKLWTEGPSSIAEEFLNEQKESK